MSRSKTTEFRGSYFIALLREMAIHWGPFLCQGGRLARRSKVGSSPRSSGRTANVAARAAPDPKRKRRLPHNLGVRKNLQLRWRPRRCGLPKSCAKHPTNTPGSRAAPQRFRPPASSSLEPFPVILNQQHIEACRRRACPGDPDNVALPCHTIEVAGTSPATTARRNVSI